jgi:Glycosyl transferases group 1
MRHVVLRNPLLQGWEYGMLRAFEGSIIKETNASVIDLPFYSNQRALNRFQHGMRLSPVRKLLPKKKIAIEADVIWCILMGPENLTLDLFRGWKTAKHRIVYLFDTLPPQYPLIQKLFSNDDFNIKLTSFNDAKADLEKLTGQKWMVIEQAASSELFHSVPYEEKSIHFSSYGRKWPLVHHALMEFCSNKNLYYDFTTHNGKHPTAEPEDLYRQYAWHLNHSLFTISWPVEFTNPHRAGQLHPITCRWFEAANSGTVILGKSPDNEMFSKSLFPNLVVDLKPSSDKTDILRQLDDIWAKRKELYIQANKMREENHQRLTWENRVKRILGFLNHTDFGEL